MSSTSKLLWVLILVALGVWGYVAFRLAGEVSPDEAVASQLSVQNMAKVDFSLLKQKEVKVDTSIRDPFKSYLYEKKPKPKITKTKKVTRKKAVPKKQVTPPTAKVNGVLWGANPVAILKKNGKTELVKKGQEVWGFKVKKVTRSGVTVVKEGQEFVLTE